MVEWRQVPNFENYMVSSDGKVFNMVTRRFIGNKNSDKYYYARLKLRNENGICYIDVHRLVAEVFIPNLDKKAVVNHKNGIKTDNRVENLEWLSSSENNIHALRTGLKGILKGECIYTAKLNREQVEYIRIHCKPYDKELGIRPLSKQFGVSSKAIRDCVYRRSWK